MGHKPLLSALQFHGLTTQLPHEVWIALGAKAWAPLESPRLRISRYSPSTLIPFRAQTCRSIPHAVGSLFVVRCWMFVVGNLKTLWFRLEKCAVWKQELSVSECYCRKCYCIDKKKWHYIFRIYTKWCLFRKGKPSSVLLLYSVRPISVKKAIALSKDSTTMPTLSIRSNLFSDIAGYLMNFRFR